MKNRGLYETVSLKSYRRRCLDVTILLLLFSLLIYRLLHIRKNGFAWILAFLCESSFAFHWILVLNIKWSPIKYIPHPQLLQNSVPKLPAVDIFVTTADPVLEPPIITVNTVLSLLAVDYPANKLACYVHDDGCSPLVYYSLVEAINFAKLWVPYCKRYNIQVRAPFRHFLHEPIETLDGHAHSKEFQKERNKMEEEYEKLKLKLEDAGKKPFPQDGQFAIFSNAQRSNHPSIVKVIWEWQKKDNVEDEVPHLVYVSREKRPNHPHEFKAGAMNVLFMSRDSQSGQVLFNPKKLHPVLGWHLNGAGWVSGFLFKQSGHTRVSGLMTNAAFMLNVDCDMYINSPTTFYQAMCLLLGSDNETDSGFVQFPQLFHDSPADELVVIHKYMGHGIVGIQGPYYSGTGCFHRREIIYDLLPHELENEIQNGKSVEELKKQFGNSEEFVKSADKALRRKVNDAEAISLPGCLEAAHQVASSSYENGTSWGTKVGWIYGTTSEDVNTGLKIHGRGWKSQYIASDPPAILGCAPPGGPAAMSQQKRWANGLLEIMLSRNCPIYPTLFGKLQFRQLLAYSWILLWGSRAIPELTYTLLSAYCIINNSSIMPKVDDPAIYIPVTLFVVYNLYTLSEYLETGLSISSWWLNQRFSRIKVTSAWLFGAFEIVLKSLGLSEAVFIVTKKDTSKSEDDDGSFIFDDSVYFIPGTVILLVHVLALVSLLFGLQPSARNGVGSGLGELICSLWVVMSYWPFLNGLFGKGKYGIPISTIWKSVSLAYIFVHLSRRT